MAQIPGSVRFTGFIAPSDSSDTYYVLDPIYGKGGYREVANSTERDAITVPRRREGMMVFIQDVHKFYYLLGGIDNANWTEFTGGGVTETVNVDHGGTGITAVPSGRILFGNDTTTLSTSSNLFWDNLKNQLIVPSLVLNVGALGAITQGELQYDGTNLYFSTSALKRERVITSVVPPPTYVITNDTVLRTLDSKNLDLDQIGNFLGTLVADLRAVGLIS